MDDPLDLDPMAFAHAALVLAKKWAEESSASISDRSMTMEERVAYGAAEAQVSQAWSFVSLAASNLVPAPEDVYRDAVEDLGGEARSMAERIEKAVAVLQEGSRMGARNPAIHAALDALTRS